MKKIMKKAIVFWMLLVVLIPMFGNQKVSAAEIKANDDAASVYIEGYTVTNESIIPGLDFTLTVTVANYSNTNTIKNLLLNIDNPEGVVPEYSTITQAYIDEIRPKSSVDISFNYTADATIQGTNLNFTASVLNDVVIRTAQLRIPVSRTTDLTVENVSMPESYAPGKVNYVSAIITNSGSGDISNAVLKIKNGNTEIASTNVGTMAAGNTKTQSVSVSFEKEGNYDIQFVLDYTDNNGNEREYVLASGKAVVKALEVVNNTPVNDGTVDQQEEQPADSTMGNNVWWIGLCGIVLVVLCIVILILIFKRK